MQDANWNVIALVSASGSVQERFTYTAYGTATALNPNFSAYSGTNYHWTTLFAAMDTDPATGLDYDNARWYNASLGEFITTDPAQADPNTYRYAGDNPITQTDPTGQLAFRAWTWDPVRNRFFDNRTGETFAEVQAQFAAKLAAEQASIDAPPGSAQATGQSIQSAKSGGWNSFGNSLWSIGQAYYALGQGGFSGTGQSAQTLQDAYDQGIFGQTKDAGGVTYYGTRGAIGIATVAAAAAGSVLTYDALLATGSGQITATELYGQTHVVYAEAGGSMFHALGATGSVEIVGVTSAKAPAVTFLNTITIPLRNPGAVTAFSEAAAANGTAFYNCLTAALNGIAAGL